MLVPWDGPALRSATRYHWRVEVWDETGAAAGTAQTWFETGLLHRDDWTARYGSAAIRSPSRCSTRPPTNTRSADPVERAAVPAARVRA